MIFFSFFSTFFPIVTFGNYHKYFLASCKLLLSPFTFLASTFCSNLLCRFAWAFCKSSFNPADTQPLWLHGVITLRMQDLTLPYFIEHHGVHVNPFLQSVKVPSVTALPLYPSVWYCQLKNMLKTFLATGFQLDYSTADCNFLRLAVWVISYFVHQPSSYLSVWFIMVL